VRARRPRAQRGKRDAGAPRGSNTPRPFDPKRDCRDRRIHAHERCGEQGDAGAVAPGRHAPRGEGRVEVRSAAARGWSRPRGLRAGVPARCRVPIDGEHAGAYDLRYGVPTRWGAGSGGGGVTYRRARSAARARAHEMIGASRPTRVRTRSRYWSSTRRSLVAHRDGARAELRLPLGLSLAATGDFWNAVQQMELADTRTQRATSPGGSRVSAHSSEGRLTPSGPRIRPRSGAPADYTRTLTSAMVCSRQERWWISQSTPELSRWP